VASKNNLKTGVLSPLETIGQSIANVAPTATPALIISQVYGLSGNGTWLAYLIATVAAALVAANINPVSYTHLDVYKRQLLSVRGSHALATKPPANAPPNSA